MPYLTVGEAYCAKDGMSLFAPTTNLEVEKFVTWFSSTPKSEALIGMKTVKLAFIVQMKLLQATFYTNIFI